MTDDPTAALTALRGERESLKAAMRSGVERAEDADTGSLKYRPYAEMRQALADLDAAIRDLEAQAAPPAHRRTRQIVMTGRTGW